MYSIKLTAAGRRIGIKREPVSAAASGRAGTLPHTLSGSAYIFAPAMMYGFRERRRERRFK
jgi:hypothetical protein